MGQALRLLGESPGRYGEAGGPGILAIPPNHLCLRHRSIAEPQLDGVNAQVFSAFLTSIEYPYWGHFGLSRPGVRGVVAQLHFLY